MFDVSYGDTVTLHSILVSDVSRYSANIILNKAIESDVCQVRTHTPMSGTSRQGWHYLDILLACKFFFLKTK